MATALHERLPDLGDDDEHVRDDLIVRHAVDDERSEAVANKHPRDRHIPTKCWVGIEQLVSQLLDARSRLT